MEEKKSEKNEIVIEKMRDDLVKIAVDKYEDASVAGLCAKGAFEASIDALKTADLTKLLNKIERIIKLNY
jgi:hypothetical protein